MGTARTIESYWLCGKRWELEAAIAKTGHRWPKSHRERRPMSAAEHGALILSYLDSRNDPEGRFDGSTPGHIEQVEDAAHWTGTPGVLWRALVETGWIDLPADGSAPRWHDYWTFNGRAIQARLNASVGGQASAQKRGGTGYGKRGAGGRFDRADSRTDHRTDTPNRHTEPTAEPVDRTNEPNRRPNASTEQSESGSVSEVRVRVLPPPKPPPGGLSPRGPEPGTGAGDWPRPCLTCRASGYDGPDVQPAYGRDGDGRVACDTHGGPRRPRDAAAAPSHAVAASGSQDAPEAPERGFAVPPHVRPCSPPRPPWRVVGRPGWRRSRRLDPDGDGPA